LRGHGWMDGWGIARRDGTGTVVAPVGVGDTIRVLATVRGLCPHPRRADRGRVVFGVEVVNHRGEIVNKGRATIVVVAEPQGE